LPRGGLEGASVPPVAFCCFPRVDRSAATAASWSGSAAVVSADSPGAASVSVRVWPSWPDGSSAGSAAVSRPGGGQSADVESGAFPGNDFDPYVMKDEEKRAL